jgi:hypothetical protein
MKALFIFLTAVFCVCSGLSQERLSAPKLVGTWAGGEDFGEFIWHRTELLGYYLKQDSGGKIVVRLCSKGDLPFALASSKGFAFSFPTALYTQDLPLSRAYISRWSGCSLGTEQYWFLPTGTDVKYDEIVPIESIKSSRFIETHHEKPVSCEAEKEFLQNLNNFIYQLKSDPKARGFIFSNIGTRKIKLQKALRYIQVGKIDRKRYQLIRKAIYSTVYPEFILISIDNSKASSE